MKLAPTTVRIRRGQRAWALLAVITLSACALILLASVMEWADSNAAITARNNETFATAYAAEAATEKVLATMSQQYQNYGFSLISQNLSSYATILPSVTPDGSYWGSYQYGNGTTAGSILVSATATNITNVIANNSPYASYAGLTFVGNTYQIIANAQNTNTLYKIVSTVGQQINLGVIPLFQFAIFYQGDMEVAPGAAMNISGPVHGNANIFLDPQAALVFSNNVSASGNIYTNQSPLDLSSRTFASVTFDGLELADQPPLNLPVSTNTDSATTNSSQSAYGILELPQSGQTPSSSTGSNLLYNQADMIIIISNNNTISVTSGAGVNNQATVISNSQWQYFLSTNGSFTDQRDNLTVNPVVLNVSNLVIWSATNTTLSTALAAVRPGEGNVQSIYVADLRSTSNATVTISYITNTTTSGTYPAAGTFTPPVITNTSTTTQNSPPSAGTYVGTVTTNTSSTTQNSVPSAGTYTGAITTNTSSTTQNSFPPNGTYLGAVTTNTTSTTTVGLPAAGTYTGSITTNRNHGVITGYTYNLIKNYTYNQINNYTYNQINNYTFTLINNYTYSLITTNSITNWTIVSQPGIVLSNGAALPPQGLSIATPDPAYIIGNWNVKLTNNSSASSDAGLNQTTYSEPSAVYADAITVLSPAWNSANSATALSSRTATSDTVNAAFLTGNVPSDGSNVAPGYGYSGGVENFVRFLENWGGQTFTYNGSMVQMFNSQIATNVWPSTGTVYNPPTRDWAFDNNYSNPAKQPPMTPKVIAVQRGQWALLTPRATTMTNVSSY